MSSLPPNRHPFEVKALQLRSYAYSESDLIVVLFTREYGLIRAIARGVRKPRSRLAGLIAPLRCNHLLLKRGRNLHGISQAESIHAFSGLQQDYDRLMAGMAIGELVSQFCQEEDAQPDLFDILLATLFRLNSGSQPRETLLWFLLFFLAHQGYYQDWYQCQACAKRFGLRDPRFQNVREGGVRCENCRQGPDHRPLTAAQGEALIAIQQVAAPTLDDKLKAAPALASETLALSEKELNGLIWNLQQLLQHLIGHELRSFAFLYPNQTSVSTLSQRGNQS